MAKTSKLKKVTTKSSFVQIQEILLEDFQDDQDTCFPNAQSVTISAVIKVLIRAKAFKDAINLVRYQSRDLLKLHNVFKSLLLVMITFFLQACVPFGLYQSAYIAGVDFFNPHRFKVSSQVKALPYAMQIVQHEGKTAVMILAFAENNHLTWVDGENNGFTTYHGKIVSSNGLANDIDTINPPDLLAVFNTLGMDSKSRIEKKSLVRFIKPATSYLEAFHNFELKKPKPNAKFKRSLDAKEISYVILEEKVQVPSLSWSYSNFYWFDLNGKILKSKQYLTPDQSKYYLETLKDFGG